MIQKSDIISILKEKESAGGLHVDVIADKLILRGITSEEKEEVKKQVTAVLNRDVKSKDPETTKVSNGKNGYKKGVYKIKQQKKPRSPLMFPVAQPDDDVLEQPILEENSKTNLFIGKAGECAVMSELLFRGYNANSMMVDDGVDIVANKNNIYYFIQVKTTEVRGGRIYATVRQNRFDAFIGNQIRYVIVGRYKIENRYENLYFVFSNDDIQRFIHNGALLQTSTDIRFKIKIECGVPYLYHTKEEDISFYLDKFL